MTWGEESTGGGQNIFTRTETRPLGTSLMGIFHAILRLLTLFAGMFVGREINEIQMPHASVSKWCVGSSAAGKWSDSPMVFAAKCWAVCGCLCEVQGKPTSLEYCVSSIRDF